MSEDGLLVVVLYRRKKLLLLLLLLLLLMMITITMMMMMTFETSIVGWILERTLRKEILAYISKDGLKVLGRLTIFDKINIGGILREKEVSDVKLMLKQNLQPPKRGDAF